MTDTGYSLSDIAAASGSRNGDDMWGGNAWWIIILLLFGWGRNGFGNNNSGATDGYELYV